MPITLGNARKGPTISDLLEDPHWDDDTSQARDALQHGPVLGSRSDWKPWYQEIEGIARLGGVWDYVDPQRATQLEPPTRPAVPKPSAVGCIAKRKQDETQEEYDLRLQQHRLQLELVHREYAINQDRYRIDCLEYSIKLAEHATAKDEMNQLNRAIISSVTHGWRSQLLGADAATPRLKLRKLEALLTEPNHQDSPISATIMDPMNVAKITAKLERKGDRDWLAWANEVSELWDHCLDVGETSNDSRFTELFLENARSHHEEFCQSWRYTGHGASFEDLIQGFIQTLLLDQGTGLFHEFLLEKKMEMLGLHIPSVQSSPSLPSLQSLPPVKLAKPAKRAQAKSKARKCPGCEAVHRFTGDAWWESCWVYHSYMGRKGVPGWFQVPEEGLRCVKRRLFDYPVEEDLALEWLTE